MKKNITISFIGAGNVSHHLAHSLYQNGYKIEWIYNRTLANARKIASKVGARALKKITGKEKQSDIIFVALKDDIIDDVLSQFSFFTMSLLVHTSGSFSTKDLGLYAQNIGCGYFFNTIKKGLTCEFQSTYCFVECQGENNSTNEKTLINLIETLGCTVEKMDTETRQKLHLAGVGMNNFTHYLWSVLQEYCQKEGLNHKYLEPIVQTTIKNVFESENGFDNQTGPARRGDVELVQQQIDKLYEYEDFQTLYVAITQLIFKRFQDSYERKL